MRQSAGVDHVVDGITRAAHALRDLADGQGGHLCFTQNACLKVSNHTMNTTRQIAPSMISPQVIAI